MNKFFMSLFYYFGFELHANLPKFKLYKIKNPNLFRRTHTVSIPECGMYTISPMPNLMALRDYYGYNKTSQLTFTIRDLAHYLLLRNHTTIFTKNAQKKILNFGSGGGGGISNLFFGLGWNVSNIEISGFENSLKDYVVTNSISKLNNYQADLVYGSHSLEHVHDIHKQLKDFSFIANSSTLFFFEVPDASFAGNGGLDGLVVPPHTYYYTHNFFKTHFKEVIYLETIDSKIFTEGPLQLMNSKRLEGQGDVIRFIGRGIELEINCMSNL
jgi:hypothetical protein